MPGVAHSGCSVCQVQGTASAVFVRCRAQRVQCLSGAGYSECGVRQVYGKVSAVFIRCRVQLVLLVCMYHT